jgi:hypothetical protein
MCDSASPGLCLMGQQVAGTFFGFFFGIISDGVSGGQW